LVNKAKVKGSKWEADAVGILTHLIEGSSWKKLPTSGAMGTAIGEPLLMGDVSGRVPGFPSKFKVECKVGYSSGSSREMKQLTIKKEWFDKVAEESAHNNDTPIVLCKFDNVHSGTRQFVSMDIKVFAEIMNYISDMAKELDEVYGQLEKSKHI
jgi:hypothetical protein